nr:immunoglobulin heavy chain junction region [Macaca mulatta]MOX59849.1 immunoglobulin heavy chain junction region [Macaca mulatta]MOX60286.1 immunoglobulin heavy chain junction region [Macaca mulatta]MOX61204.1 immunoglobulin heavy chain junction region [Macaca mulatta]MOX61308.1 immunoglobulin heavy chain junction region [Macaca mulatta]
CARGEYSNSVDYW